MMTKSPLLVILPRIRLRLRLRLFFLLSLLLTLTLAADGTNNKNTNNDTDAISASNSEDEQPDDDDDQFVVKDVYRPPSYVFVLIGMTLVALCYCYIKYDKHRHNAILYNRSLQSENDDASQCGQSFVGTESSSSSSQVPENINRKMNMNMNGNMNMHVNVNMHMDGGGIVSELELPPVAHPRPKSV
jgi:hypothetical protein